jgi:hypothetical protein
MDGFAFQAVGWMRVWMEKCHPNLHPSDAISTNFFSFVNQLIGGLPVRSGTLKVCDLDPKSLDFCREI